MNEAAGAYEREIEALDRALTTLRADHDNLAARRAAALGSRVAPEEIDALDADLATLTTDLARAEELRAKLAATVPALRAREAAQVAAAAAEAAEFRARAEAFAAHAREAYPRLAGELAELLRLSAAVAKEGSALRHRHASVAAHTGVRQDYGPAPVIHKNAHLPAPDGGAPLFDDLRTAVWICSPSIPPQYRVVEWQR